ncbi:MAG: DUF3089 domain-containing protein [Chitinophagaceae bacterium]|nr:DUF3089 domain-containing protein [Chitinophagaceae bacterium]
MKSYKCYFLLPITAFIFISCSRQSIPVQETKPAHTVNKIPSYENLNNWAAHPYKKDPSDSVPKDLRSLYMQDSTVDVFFIHPTTLTSLKDTRWNADIDDEILNKKTDNSTILYQASVFNQSCRVFAPRYRQAHIKSFFIDSKQAEPYFNTAYADIEAAFKYYLENYNNGRPIIIASHSQGTLHAARLLKEFFENKPLQNKLVCAYLIGMPVSTTYFSVLQPCSNAWQTGCFVSWRTIKKNYNGPSYIQKENYQSVVVNPLTWTIDSLYAPSKKNKGGVLKNFNKIIPGVVSTQIHKMFYGVVNQSFWKYFYYHKKLSCGRL